MRLFQFNKNSSYASAGLIATLVAVVWCASCGSKSNGLGTGGDDSDGGDDATSCTGFGCSTGSSSGSSGGGNSSGTLSGNGDSGLPTVTAQNGLVSDNKCPGTVSASTVTALQAGGSNSAALTWLYPYASTVFPGGLPSPVLQWSQTGTPDSVYVHLSSQKYDFKGCYAGSNPPELKLDETEWATAYAQSAGNTDPLTVQITTTTGGTVSGPITETLIFAKGSLAGDVYYNTYGSKLVPGQVGQNGAVMRIANGASAPTPFLYTTGGSVYPFGPCVSCHSLSSNGQVMAAQQHTYPGDDPLTGKGSMSFNLKTTPMPTPTTPMASTVDDDWGFSALYPDGSILLTSGEPGDSTTTPLFPGVAGNNPAMIGPKPATMYNTSTGATIPFTGLTSPWAMMPMFSPDGLHIVYTEAPAADAGTGGHTLTMMDFNVSTKTFSNPKQIFHDDTKYPGWAFFTPDAKQIIFTLGNTNNYASEEPPTGTIVYAAQLYTVDVASGTSHRLDETSGYNSAGTTYLPFPSNDENLDFYPTVSPVSAGGYYWVYFTSRRTYGNLYAKGPTDIGSKSIWVSAIDIDPAPGTDSSHPAFYLPGQELGSGNIRAFSVLAPCAGNGATCESGIDCCGGSCTTGKCGVPATCAGENDACSATTPCCDTNDQCLGGFCGFIVK